MLKTYLKRLTQEYASQRTKPFTGSDFANFVRHDLAIEAKKRTLFLPFEYKVKASVGQGGWAAVPWLAFFDPIVTETATKGVYIVYLVNPIDETLTLSMNQGTTIVFEQFGTTRGYEVLKRRAQDLNDLVLEYSNKFERTPINLGSDEKLPKGYEAGHAFGRTYAVDQIESDLLDADLEIMFHAYKSLVDRGANTPIDLLREDAGTVDISETRKYILSRRIERAPNVRKKVLAVKPPICEACGLDPKIHYSYEGKLGNIPLDVHHSKPVSQLAEGETARYVVPDDFMLLCPNCHKMIHTLPDPSDLETLKRKITFALPNGVPKNRMF